MGKFEDIKSDIAKEEKKTNDRIMFTFQIDSYDYRPYENMRVDIQNDKAKNISSVECKIQFGTMEESKDIDKHFPQVTDIVVKDLLNSNVNIRFTVKEGYRVESNVKFAITQKRSLSPEDFDENYDVEALRYETDIRNGFDHFLPKAVFDNPALDKEYRDVKQELKNFFLKKLYYIGPLRTDPKEYADSRGQYRGVGYRGEYTAECYVLADHQSKSYAFLSLKNNFSIKEFLQKLDGNLDAKHTGLNLADAVSEWIKYIEVADGIEIDEAGELCVVQNGRKRRLNNVGIGVSQVLPIIVQCIAADAGSTIIIEQPELHLHPKMQSRLADFFLAMSLLGKQLIIETHSEYIIDKLRLRIVQAPLDQPINDKVAIYFAEKHKGDSAFRRIRLNEYSVMSEWPKGFFEDSMQIAREILFAARQKEKDEKKDGPSEDDDD
jgi:predicted ATPase